jgi:hypothetical protein
MKNLLKFILLGILCSTCFAMKAQDQPYLSLSKDSPTTVQINWTNQVGTTYRVWFTPDLATPFSLWTPLEDAFSDDETVSVNADTTATPAGFFRVEIPTNSGVQIFSPPDSQTVSSEIAIRIGAQLGTQVQGVNLYLDDALVGYLDSGGMNFALDTTHFTNGTHTVYVGAVDTANNETLSSPITLDFENSVRWLDAVSLFQSSVPIDIESDIFPADWAVFVSDANGTIIRTISGTTSDGNINTNWDGNDQNGDYAPDQAAYHISAVVTSTGSGSFSAMSSELATGSRPPAISSALNRYGVAEYEIEKPAPDLMAVFSNALEVYSQLPEWEKTIYPPLDYLTNVSTAPIIEKLSARDMFVLQHQITNVRTLSLSANNSSGGSGSASTYVWREPDWNSGEIVIARQKLTGFNGIVFDGTAANLCDQIKNLVATAQDEIDNGSHRGVYQNSIMTMQHNGDFNGVKTGLASNNPNTREFYFWGHGAPNGNAIGFREGTPNDGVMAKELNALLGNSYQPATNGNGPIFITAKPFDFVFLDGCMTGLGSFPEAFGIPKAMPAFNFDGIHAHKRAFMGWGGEISFSILDTESINWSLAFWNSWVSNPNSETLIQAQAAAFAAHPSGGDGAPMRTYGNLSLKWSDYH